MKLPKLIPRDKVHERLRVILPVGVTGRPVLNSPVTASVVWIALFCGAVNRSRYIRPSMVCWMRDSIAKSLTDSNRDRYWNASKASQKALATEYPTEILETSWYADNTREVIRDDVLRNGLWALGAVLRDESQPTNSSKPVWCLQQEFMELFDPSLSGPQLEQAISKWQTENLSEILSGRLRSAQAAHTSQHEVNVALPDGTHRALGAGTSSLIAKGVIEEFSMRTLSNVQVLALSEGREHVSPEDAVRLKARGLNPQADRVLPDIVLLDQASNMLWCIEVVATDGPVNELRKSDLIRWAGHGGFEPEAIKLVTAFTSRTSNRFRALFPTLAQDTGIWFLDEPQLLVWLQRI